MIGLSVCYTPTRYRHHICLFFQPISTENVLLMTQSISLATSRTYNGPYLLIYTKMCIEMYSGWDYLCGFLTTFNLLILNAEVMVIHLRNTDLI